MKKALKKFNSDMSNSDFINSIVYLDNIDNGNLNEEEDNYISDFYNNLYKMCAKQIDSNINNTTLLTNRGETIGEFMNFLRMVET